MAEHPDARDLQAVPLADGGVVLKRGVREVLLDGTGIDELVATVLPLLDGSREPGAVLDALPAEHRPEAERLLGLLAERRLLSNGHRHGGGGDAAFYASFGAEHVPLELERAAVAVVGANLVTRALVRSLLELGLGHVTLVDHPALGEAWPRAEVRGERRLAVVPEADTEAALHEAELVCAASVAGESEALLDLNRLALQAERRFLPAWLGDMVAHVGPLTVPFETACLRCYRLRVDANDPRPEVSAALRRHVASDPRALTLAPVLPPMAAMLGELVALEAAKVLGRFVPSDTVGRHLELNAISFGATVRRVLKLPRCPDCGDVMRRAATALAVGPQIPQP